MSSDHLDTPEEGAPDERARSEGALGELTEDERALLAPILDLDTDLATGAGTQDHQADRPVDRGDGAVNDAEDDDVRDQVITDFSGHVEAFQRTLDALTASLDADVNADVDNDSSQPDDAARPTPGPQSTPGPGPTPGPRPASAPSPGPDDGEAGS